LAVAGDQAWAERVRELSTLSAPARLLLFDLALPSVLALPMTDRDALLRALDRLAEPDLAAGLFDLLLLVRLQTEVDKHGDSGDREPDPDATARTGGNAGAAMNLLFSALARAAGRGTDVERAFAAASARAPASYRWRLLPDGRLSAGALIGAGLRLARLHPSRKRALVAACAAAVVENRRVSLAEGQLLRVICSLLAVPVPPLLPGQLRYLASLD
jgi:hypothetical protein